MPGMLHWVVLRGPHLILANLRSHHRFPSCEFPELLNNLLRHNLTALIVPDGKWIIPLPLCNLIHPGCVAVSRRFQSLKLFQQPRQHLLGVPHYGNVYRHAAWMDQVAEWKRDNPLPIRHDEGGEIMPEQDVQKLWELTGGEAVMTTEVGQNQMWAAQYYQVKHPRHFISSGGLGTMGYGLPAAVGAPVSYTHLT